MARKKNNWRSRVSYEERGESNKATSVARSREQNIAREEQNRASNDLMNQMILRSEGNPHFLYTPYLPWQQEAIKDRYSTGLKDLEDYFKNYEQLTRAKTPQERSLADIEALSSVGATPGSYGGALGQLAGGALGGPTGSAIGGVLGNIGGSLFDRYQASQAFGPFEEAARKSFQQQTIPGIAERFAGQGALGSSAFQGALGQAASDLESQLAQAKANYSAQQMDQLMKQRVLANESLQQRMDEERAMRGERLGYLGSRANLSLSDIERGLGPMYQHGYQDQAAPWWTPIASSGAKELVKFGVEQIPVVGRGLVSLYNIFGQQGERRPTYSSPQVEKWARPYSKITALNKLLSQRGY